MLEIFRFKPENYKQIDNYLSRSAQPLKDNMQWLKEQGVTDVINLRNMSNDNFDEAGCVEDLGMNYHSIPSVTKFIKKENIQEFLDIIEKAKRNGGKVHIHCKHGSDRTGMFSYIYERLNNVGTPQDNLDELTQYNWHKEKYPDLVKWAEAIIEMFNKKPS